jgi:hypothetical protein
MTSGWYYEFLLPGFLEKATHSEILRHDELLTEIRETSCVIDGMPKWRFRRRHKLLWRLGRQRAALQSLMERVSIFRIAPLRFPLAMGGV